MDCCGRLHSASAIAATAEELMRARYSAFALGNADYLLSTWAPEHRPTELSLDPSIEWRRLRVRGTGDGEAGDDRGTVDFIAHYWDAGKGEYGRQQENSRFDRRRGRWLYIGPAD